MTTAIICTAPERYSDLALSASCAAHRRYCGSTDFVLIDGSSQGSMHDGLMALSESGHIIITRDCIVPLVHIDPWVIRRNESIAWMNRKGVETTRMVGSLTVLMDAGLQTKDYEIDYPQVYGTAVLASVLRQYNGLSFAFRTMYFNTIGADGIPTKDPLIKWWEEGTKPEVIASLSGTCYAHRRCRQWLQTITDQPDL